MGAFGNNYMTMQYPGNRNAAQSSWGQPQGQSGRGGVFGWGGGYGQRQGFPQQGFAPMQDNRARNRELQARRSAGRVVNQAAPNLYNPGANTQAVSAVFGNEIGMGNNDPYLLHQLRGGGYAVNRGNLDPAMVALSGDYARFIT